jgi:hypothetical protein
MKELIERLLSKVESHITSHGPSGFMSGRDLHDILLSVKNDLEKDVPAPTYIYPKNMDEYLTLLDKNNARLQWLWRDCWTHKDYYSGSYLSDYGLDNIDYMINKKEIRFMIV